ncbi:cyclase family protein [Leucobacter sp. CSA2]|uniref:Cyclase family protein n=1 Tax=Leucobacter edaphi TaxID=2796472 RepID=A0A934QAN6_9MICO|nr:cyclase family protein [Leucobacter edaphi]MBK0421229.1 cyclase family protein [Leucobacter edaphi]
MLIDLSPAVDAQAPTWPGDARFSVEERWSHARGDAVEVATVTTTGHVGAHYDAPRHILPGAADGAAVALESTIGRCLVLDVREDVGRGTQPWSPVPAERLITVISEAAPLSGSRPGAPEQRVERVLIRHFDTALATWEPATPGIDPAFVDWFGEQGGLLIGTDLASLDPAASKDLPAHRAALDAGIAILEGLDLSEAPVGVHELIAPPVHWLGTDALPVRAVLRVEG